MRLESGVKAIVGAEFRQRQSGCKQFHVGRGHEISIRVQFIQRVTRGRVSDQQTPFPFTRRLRGKGCVGAGGKTLCAGVGAQGLSLDCARTRGATLAPVNIALERINTAHCLIRLCSTGILCWHIVSGESIVETPRNTSFSRATVRTFGRARQRSPGRKLRRCTQDLATRNCTARNQIEVRK